LDLHDFWRWVHIMLFVLWLGADVGVFICGWWIRRPTLSLEQRMVLLQASGVIDLWPRVSAALMLPAGLMLAVSWVPALTWPWLVSAWLVAGAWIVLTFVGMRLMGTPGGLLLQRITSLGLVVLAVACVAGGASLITGTTPGLQWLGGKLLLYALVCILAIGIEVAFRPVIAGFGMLADRATREQGDALVRQGMNRTLTVVAVLYATLVAASILGVFKPA
jgi:hypothetical protein